MTFTWLKEGQRARTEEKIPKRGDIGCGNPVKKTNDIKTTKKGGSGETL